MTDWTPEQVAARLHEAAQVLKRMPETTVRGYFNVWPTIRPSFADLVGQEARARRVPPAPAAIDRMEAALPWVQCLEPELGRLVWARAEGAPWKAICARFGIARATADRRYRYGLAVIALTLNGRRVPAKRSRAFARAQARRLSRGP